MKHFRSTYGASFPVFAVAIALGVSSSLPSVAPAAGWLQDVEPPPDDIFSKPQPEKPNTGPIDPHIGQQDAPFPVRGDNADEFISRAASKMAERGERGAVGHLVPHLTPRPLTVGKKTFLQEMKAVGVINYPVFAGGRPVSDNDQKQINKAQALIRAHEERHRAIMEKFVRQFCKDVQGGKPTDEYFQLYNRMIDQMNAAQDQLDAVEGMIHSVHADGGTQIVDVVLVPVPRP